jgi:hypothetical protein
MYPPSIEVGGTATAGDVLSVTATPAQGGMTGLVPPPFTFAYTVQTGDTPATMATGLYAAFAKTAPLLCGLTATLSGATVSFDATPGIWALTPSVEPAPTNAGGAASETLTVATIPATGISPIAGAQVLAISAWPTANDLDAIAASPSLQISTGAPLRAIVSVFAPRGYYRNTTRYLPEWQVLTPAVPTLTASVSGNTITIGGTVSVPQTIVAIIGAASWRRVYTYTVQATDSLAWIAAQLANLINADTPAAAGGATITVPDAFDLIARVSASGAVSKELERQVERFEVHVWAPSPAVRDAVARPIRLALAATLFPTLADGTAAELRICGDHLLDDPQKAGIYRRVIMCDVEYATTWTLPAAQVAVFEAQQQAGELPEAAAPTTVLHSSTEAPAAAPPAAAPIKTASLAPSISTSSMPETIIELGTLSTYTLPDGLIVGQRVLIVDNLGTAESVHPVITGHFDIGPSFTLTQNYQSAEPVWDGTQWVMA